MKKLLIVFLVLAMCSAASAYSVGFRVAPGDQKDHYAPSDTITIELYTDDPRITGVTIDAIVDDDDYGTAHTPLTYNSNFNGIQSPGSIKNSGGSPNILIEWINLTDNVDTTDATGVLHTFEYHVPDKDPSTIITIDDYYDDMMYLEGSVVGQGGTYGAAAIGGVEIHIIPEPATIALLGLGGFLLRRRK